MAAKIPAHVREQQINELPNITFVRWDGEYKNAHSKAVCQCAVDGVEWMASIDSLLRGSGCPKCAGNIKKQPQEYEQQINALPNITFVRWVGGYTGAHSKAVCRCADDGFEWVATPANLLKGAKGTGCPQCSGVRRWSAEERIAQINAKPDVSFLRWDGVYNGFDSKAVCRCAIDGFEWVTSVSALVNHGTGCPRCAGNIKRSARECEQQINAIPNITFIRWDVGYKNQRSKAICRCAIDGFEWAASVSHLINSGTGCPQCCCGGGYKPTEQGTLYILRSECGSMVKIGISNDYKTRHSVLKRATPFDWHCIELLHSDDGSLIAEWEKELHSWTEQAEFREPFDGYTEWRKWDDRLPMWLKRFRARLER